MDAIRHGDVVQIRDRSGAICYSGRVDGENSKGTLYVTLTYSCSRGAHVGDVAQFHPKDWNITKRDT